MKKSKIQKIISLAETRFLSLYNMEYTNKAGNSKSWIASSRKSFKILNEQIFDGRAERVDAVVIVAVHKEINKLVLVKQFRVPINDYIYELPAGLLEKDEEIFSAVKRELKEETGLELLEINEKDTIGKVYLSPGMTDESVALIYCTCTGAVSQEFLEEDEDLECILVSKEEAKGLLKSNEKIDVKAYMTLKEFSEN